MMAIYRYLAAGLLALCLMCGGMLDSAADACAPTAPPAAGGTVFSFTQPAAPVYAFAAPAAAVVTHAPAVATVQAVVQPQAVVLQQAAPVKQRVRVINRQPLLRRW